MKILILLPLKKRKVSLERNGSITFDKKSRLVPIITPMHKKFQNVLDAKERNREKASFKTKPGTKD